MKNKNTPQIPPNPDDNFIENRPKYSPVKKAVVGLGIVAAGASGVHGGGEVIHDTVQAKLEAVYEGHVQEAKLVANRYAACTLEGQPAVEKTSMRTAKRDPLDKITFTIKTERNPESQRVEEKYVDDDTIAWYSWPTAVPVKRSSDDTYVPAGRAVVNRGQDGLSTVEKPYNKVSVYPERSLPAGTQLAIYAGTNAENADYDLKRVYSETTRKYCGMIELTKDGAGHNVWKRVEDAPAMLDINEVKNYDLVNTPGSGPNSYTQVEVPVR